MCRVILSLSALCFLFLINHRTLEYIGENPFSILLASFKFYTQSIKHESFFFSHYYFVHLSERLIGLPDSMLKNKSSPQVVPSLEGVFIDDVAVGCEHVLSLSATGDVYAWGCNSEGQVTSIHHQNIKLGENKRDLKLQISGTLRPA